MLHRSTYVICVPARNQFARDWNRRVRRPSMATSGDPEMQESLADGGVIRKLWIGEAEPLSRPPAAPRRRQPPQPVRRRRVRRIHPQLRRHDVRPGRRRRMASSPTACCAAPPNCARWGAPFAREAEAALSIESRLAEPRRRLGAARPHAARRPKPRHQDAAHGLPGQQPPDAGIGAEIRRRTELRFRRRGRRGGGGAADAAVGAAGTGGRQLRLCHRGARCPVQIAENPVFSAQSPR